MLENAIRQNLLIENSLENSNKIVYSLMNLTY
ncbi:hypothetical protein SAMN06265350_102407 [Solitalea koreensis]|uniref:Uncharacterized protein n=1 Tax=Solitalea koreensis TaxID=543615 RepID=A0A521BQA4_9SPHI|nr:hypothetical protein SAMN06265350_102407 [Solitalea koreensis]